MNFRITVKKYRRLLRTMIPLLMLAGCDKDFGSHHLLNTIDLASYRGRTWTVLNVSEHYQRTRSTGESYDSVIYYPRDTTQHLYLATDWNAEIPPKLLPVLNLMTPCRWYYDQELYNIVLSSNAGVETFSINLWDQGDNKIGRLPLLQLSTNVPETVFLGATPRQKRVDLDLELVGDGKL